jgi:hypothetical protein
MRSQDGFECFGRNSRTGKFPKIRESGGRARDRRFRTAEYIRGERKNVSTGAKSEPVDDTPTLDECGSITGGALLEPPVAVQTVAQAVHFWNRLRIRRPWPTTGLIKSGRRGT